MKMNKEWHLKHTMPKNSSIGQRIKWHFQHQKNCSCRPSPEKLAQEMKKRGIKLNKAAQLVARP
jgi:hypothetical protein